MDTRIAVIAIIVEDRSKSGELNGLPMNMENICRKNGSALSSEGSAVISVILGAPQEKIRLCPESWNAGRHYQ